MLCPHCKEAYTPSEGELLEVGLRLEDAAGTSIYRAGRCDECNQTGYRGRIAIFEILVVDDEIRAMIGRGVDGKTIENAAIRKGMSTMRIDGSHKVLAGVTSIAEVLRQTEEEIKATSEPEVA